MYYLHCLWTFCFVNEIKIHIHGGDIPFFTKIPDKYIFQNKSVFINIFFHFYRFAKSIISIIVLEFVKLYCRKSNFRLKCWKQMLQNSFAILQKSNIQCCSLQTFLNVRIKLYTYTLSVLLLLNHLSFYFQRSGFTMGRVTDQFSSYLSRRCLSPSASSGTTTITKVRFDKNLVQTVVIR